MKTRRLFLLFIVLSVVVSVSAQSKSVTNADLQSYQQSRLKAERDYRENYERLGLPSPEEIDRRREQSRIETEQLAAKLREESLVRDQLEAQWRANARLAAAYYQPAHVAYAPYWSSPYYFWSYGSIPRPIRPPIKHPTPYVRLGYFAGGQFWLTGSRPANASIRNVPEANGSPR